MVQKKRTQDISFDENVQAKRLMQNIFLIQAFYHSLGNLSCRIGGNVKGSFISLVLQ